MRRQRSTVKMSERFTEPGELAQKWRSYVQEATGFQEIRPTHAYEDGRPFRFGSIELVAIHSPGHASDHYCFFEPRLKILFSFDIDLAAFGPSYGCRQSNIELFEASARRVHALRPRIVVSSHLGIISHRLDERFEAYLNIIPRREEEILTFLSQERRLEVMVDQAFIYGSFPYARELLRYWEGQMLRKHLERLIERGLVRERDSTYVRA